MNIREALLESKATGLDYSRDCGSGGWIRWFPDWTYRMRFDDLTADDWEPMLSSFTPDDQREKLAAYRATR